MLDGERKNKMQKLIPDTNFLIYLVKYRILDKLLDFELIIPQQILDELKQISQEKKKKIRDRESALVALEFLKSQKKTIKKEKGNADDVILIIAKKENVAIASMDKELTRRAKKENIKIVKIRQKKYLIKNEDEKI